MESAEEVSLVRRVLSHVDEKTTHMVADEGTLPVDAYVSEARLRAEQERLFHALPIAIGHRSQLSEAGDYLTHDATGLPLLVCRTREERLTAFLNVCRHRGTRLVAEPQGRRRHAFVCPYHGWTYDDAGRLRNVPHEVGFPSRPSENVSLKQVRVAEVGGLVFASGGDVDAFSFLSPLGSRLDALELSRHTFFQPETVTCKLNWKIAIELFLEGYHLKYAHQNSIYPMFFDNTGLCDRFAPHVRFVFPKRSIVALREQDPSTWRLRLHANILYFVFPNTLILVEPDFVSVSLMFPIGTDTTLMQSFHLITPEERALKPERYWQKNVDVLLSAVREDLAMGESIQKSIRSRANDHFRIARFEQGLRYFHESLNDYLSGRISQPGPELRSA